MNYAHAVLSMDQFMATENFLSLPAEKRMKILQKRNVYQVKAEKVAILHAEEKARYEANKIKANKIKAQNIANIIKMRETFQDELRVTLNKCVRVNFWNSPEDAEENGHSGVVEIDAPMLSKSDFTTLNDVFESYDLVTAGNDSFVVEFKNSQIFDWEL